MSLFLLFIPILVPFAAFALYRVIVRTGHAKGWRIAGLALLVLSLIGCIASIITLFGGTAGFALAGFGLIQPVTVLIVLTSVVVALKSWPIDPSIPSEV